MDPNLSRRTLADLLRRTGSRYPGKLAVRCGSIEWTYAEFDDICNRLGGGLAARGINPGDRVAVISRNLHAFVALRFALARVGAVLVPINFMLNADEVRFILQHSGAKMLCVDSSCAELGRAASTGSEVRETVWLPTDPVDGSTRFEQLLLSAVIHRQPMQAAKGAAVEPVLPDRSCSTGHRSEARGPFAKSWVGSASHPECRNAACRRGNEECETRGSRRDRASRAAFHGSWFHSGDLGTIDDEGYITVVDRKKDRIKTGGENVASREVEEVIYESRACATGRV